jgi:hypothetical protein
VVFAYSQEGVVRLYDGCPAETEIAARVGGICTPCFKTYPDCKICNVFGCRDEAIFTQRQVPTCSLFFDRYCKYGLCPQGYYNSTVG